MLPPYRVNDAANKLRVRSTEGSWVLLQVMLQVVLEEGTLDRTEVLHKQI